MARYLSDNILDWAIQNYYQILPLVSDHKAERALIKNAQIEKEKVYVPPVQPEGMTFKYRPIGSDLTGPQFEEAMSKYGQVGSPSEPTEVRPIKRKKESKGRKEKKQK